MLQSLHIHNFALIEDLHLTFGDGVTIFTGETGAGKSILLDAIGMLAGKRASASFVRHGTDSFLVEGAFFFSPLPEGLEQMLTDNHIEVDEGQLIISRQFQRSGRGRSWSTARWCRRRSYGASAHTSWISTASSTTA